jgi:hypothetical protein
MLPDFLFTTMLFYSLSYITNIHSIYFKIPEPSHVRPWFILAANVTPYEISNTIFIATVDYSAKHPA